VVTAPCGVTEKGPLGNHRPRPFRLRSAQPVRKLRQRVDLEGQAAGSSWGTLTGSG
jgi:hypothetical protein